MDKFIVQFMGGRQLLKSGNTLDHIKQNVFESLRDFFTCFNKELTGIDQVITSDEIICTFVRAIGPRGSFLYDSLSVIPVNTIEDMTEKVKSYIDLEIAKEWRKYHNESKKEINRSSAPKNQDDKCRPRLP